MNPLLYGSNNEERIVAVSQYGDRTMRVFFREEDTIRSTDHNFFPFFLVSDSSVLRDFGVKTWVKELDGENYFRYLCAFSSWNEMWDAIRLMIERTPQENSGKIETYADLPFLQLRTDAVSQFLLQSGRTLFKGMEFSELHRLQLDIETYTSPGSRFSNANRPGDRIIIIALSDNRGWSYCIDGKSKREDEMLRELVRIICEKDPDIIEGHNIYNFDLPYLLTRCEMFGIDFAVGRDGTSPRVFDSRMSFAERYVKYSAHEIPGRHIIDTWLLVQSYDTQKRSLESYGLKYAAKYFGFAKEDRIYIQPERISWYWDHEPDLLLRYALDDVEETRLLSEHLSQSSFYLTQMLPYNYGAVARMGSAAKIESLLMREYVRQRHSVPKPERGAQTSGGYADIFYTGVLQPIVDVDVESLYPSIMLEEKIAPSREPLGVFSATLGELTRMRLAAKRSMKAATSEGERSQIDALQSSFKILINSYYGYLGYNRALFNDMAAADRVTRTGQQILRQLITAIGESAGTVVEVDTDGIYFVPPPSVQSEEDEERFVERIAKILPKGITLAIAGRFQKMLSYKTKNYALLGYDNRIRIKGSSLTSRSIEKFGRNFLLQGIECLLNNNIDGLHSLYVNLHRDISDHALTAADFARTETLKESIESYLTSVKSGERNRTASYEVAIAAELEWKPGDRVSYYFTGSDAGIKAFENCKLIDAWTADSPDENVHYYLRRLDEFTRKFEPFFQPSDFRKIFSLEDLFGFSAEGIHVLRQHVAQKELNEEEDEADLSRPDPKIWLEENL
ncbi:MAG TPA: DNA polymerase domain-containing protein [Bacteroidota bacterium]|nr:DNA polymerase domain-containing protein [Bacteroidota bacterium]